MLATYGVGYLAHYGIKGQRWGVRRFQYENGTYTEEGKKRYGRDSEGSNAKSKEEQTVSVKGVRNGLNDSPVRITYVMKQEYRTEKADKQKFKQKIEQDKRKNRAPSKRQQQLREQFEKLGFSSEDAEIEAYRKARTEKIIKIAGVVAVSAALAYGGYKVHQYIQDHADKTISAGTKFQRVTATPNEDQGHAGFVAYNNKDKIKYRGMYGAQLSGTRGGTIYNVETEALRNMKVAGEGVASKVYNQLMKDDADFRDTAEALNAAIRIQRPDTQNWKDHDVFNLGLVGAPQFEEQASMREKFYNKLKSMGYDGVLDLNDRRHSGYNSKAPVIMFNLDEGVGNRKVSEISDDQILSELGKAQKMVIAAEAGKALMNVDMKRVAVGGAFVAGVSAYNSRKRDIRNPKRQTEYRRIIAQYKKDHPGTKLSDQEILDNQLGS